MGVDGDGSIFVRDGVPVCSEGGCTGGWGKNIIVLFEQKKQTKKKNVMVAACPESPT